MSARRPRSPGSAPPARPVPRRLARSDPAAARPDALIAALDGLEEALGSLAQILRGASPTLDHLATIRAAADLAEEALDRLGEPDCVAEWEALVREAHGGGAMLLEPDLQPGGGSGR